MKFALVALATAVSACQAQPRSVSYFEEHPDEAARVVAECRTGAHRGRECDDAQAAQSRLQGKARQDLFRRGFE